MAKVTSPVFKGTCMFCNTSMTQVELPKHLENCEKRDSFARAKRGAKNETLLHLHVSGDVDGFWLDLEARATATLQELDHYLRAIWLECCGHMSEFNVGGFGGKKVGMKNQLSAVFDGKRKTISHTYDFGTESNTEIKHVGTRSGLAFSSHPIYLMARNDMPQVECWKCNKAMSTHLCMECLIEQGEFALFCTKCAAAHGKKHAEYGEPIKLVNSPRVGRCGYEGPADPPY